jgi:hypothetical protein
VELMTAGMDAGMVNLYCLEPNSLHDILWNAFDAVVLFGDLSMVTDCTWILLDHVLRVMLNAPHLHRATYIDYDINTGREKFCYLSIFSLFRHLKSAIVNLLKNHRWTDVKAVSSLESTRVSYKEIRYEVYVSVNHQEEHKKIFLRKHGQFPISYVQLWPNSDTCLRLFSTACDIEDVLFATLHVSGQLIIYPPSCISRPAQMELSFHQQLQIRELIESKGEAQFFFKSPVLFSSLKTFHDYLGRRRKIHWMVQLTHTRDISLDDYFNYNSFCLM